MAEPEYLYKQLRRNPEGVDVVGFKEETSGVLKGQTIRCFIDAYNTEEEARAAHPDAEGWSHKLLDPQVSLSHLPGENDHVPGGALPDDIGDEDWGRDRP